MLLCTYKCLFLKLFFLFFFISFIFVSSLPEFRTFCAKLSSSWGQGVAADPPPPTSYTYVWRRQALMSQTTVDHQPRSQDLFPGLGVALGRGARPQSQGKGPRNQVGGLLFHAALFFFFHLIKGVCYHFLVPKFCSDQRDQRRTQPTTSSPGSSPLSKWHPPF